ncbi:MAG: LCP family protein [Bacillota bacterium]|nr:LCP family protein [Bacillota bacterium]
MDNNKGMRRTPKRGYRDNFVDVKSSNNAAKNKKGAKKSKKMSKKKIIIRNTVVIVLSIVLLISGIGMIYMDQVLNTIKYVSPKTTTSSGSTSGTTPIGGAGVRGNSGNLLQSDDILNLMFFGSDSGDENGRSDSEILFSIDTVHKKIKMTSFMRDTYVEIPGYGNNKINAAYALGGTNGGGPSGAADLAIQTVESNFGIKVDAYAIVDFKSFRNIIDVLGGVDLQLTESEINYINWQSFYNNQVSTRHELKDIFDPEVTSNNSDSDYTKEQQTKTVTVHLNGRQALWYSRDRGLSGYDDNGNVMIHKGIACPTVSGNDFDRVTRQKKLLSSVMSRFKTANLTQILDITKQVGPLVTTDLTKDGITSLIYNSLTYLNYSYNEFRIPEGDLGAGWSYGTASDGGSVVQINDWDKTRKDLATFIFEDLLNK